MGESDGVSKERIYRPKLEELALQLYKIRREKKELEEEDEEDLSPKIKDILENAGITKYDGKNVIVNLGIPVKQEVNIKKLSKYVSLKILYKNNLLAISSTEKLESFLKKEGKTLKPKDYLKKGKPYERLDIYLKKKK